MSNKNWLCEFYTHLNTLRISPILRHEYRKEIFKKFKKDPIDFENKVFQYSNNEFQIYIKLFAQILKQSQKDFNKLYKQSEFELDDDVDAFEKQSEHRQRTDILERLQNAEFKCDDIVESKKSTIRCKKCGTIGNNMLFDRQTRSADEGSTLFSECKKCGFISRIG